jgi:tellurite resistance protein TerC
VHSIGSPLLWVAFITFVVVMLVLDLGVFHRKAHAPTTKESAIWTAVWVAMALIFNLFVFWQWGSTAGQEFFLGYLIEKSLSVDNLFVFYVIFSAFDVKLEYQHRLLFWGIVGALVLRAAMIIGGTALLASVHWIVYVFGAILIATGARMLARPGEQPHPERSRLLRGIRRIIPTSPGDHGAKMFVRERGARLATRLFVVLIVIELTDVMFAIDSILAIFAITTDPFIVFTSNIFAIMGLRSLYLLLAGVARRFVYLQPGLALVLVFVGGKMAISPFFKVPVVVSLVVVTLLLGGSILASLLTSRRRVADNAA